MESDFLALMPDTIDFEPYLAQNEYSQASYGPAVTLRCHFEQTNKEIRNGTKLVGVAASAVFIPADAAAQAGVSVRGRFTLTDGSQPPCLGITEEHDERGPHHLVVWLGMHPLSR